MTAVLKRGLDQQPLNDEPVQRPLGMHDNIRGGDYFDRGDDPERDEGDSMQSRTKRRSTR
ncbi:MAG: hypothetical protein HC927_08345 [Deltaproteobacteria bacterium]|nr:hypothetical protein [Deltaproteobacteria bacterium]